jgi:hypothetical protein
MRSTMALASRPAAHWSCWRNSTSRKREVALGRHAAGDLGGLQRDAVEREVAIDELHQPGIDVLRLDLGQRVGMEPAQCGQVSEAYSMMTAWASGLPMTKSSPSLRGAWVAGVWALAGANTENPHVRAGFPLTCRQACPHGIAGAGETRERRRTPPRYELSDAWDPQDVEEPTDAPPESPSDARDVGDKCREPDHGRHFRSS